MDGSCSNGVEPFEKALARNGLTLIRGETLTLQVNVGKLCNQTCRHCHLEAGPGREEVMSAGTMADVVAYAGLCGFKAIDVTGGAPELLPGLPGFLERLKPYCEKLILRTNLTAFSSSGGVDLAKTCIAHGVALVASFPSTCHSQADALRGKGTFDGSIETLRVLNSFGYGYAGTGFELDLVFNPAGAYLPPDQKQLEEKFRIDLERRWGIFFNRLFAFANVPVGRFRRWLVSSGNYESYLYKLSASFNPAALTGLMCRSLVSVSWNGYLYDCDFNQACGRPLGEKERHVSLETLAPLPGTPISTGDHCYACTAGSGFT